MVHVMSLLTRIGLVCIVLLFIIYYFCPSKVKVLLHLRRCYCVASPTEEGGLQPRKLFIRKYVHVAPMLHVSCVFSSILLLFLNYISHIVLKRLVYITNPKQYDTGDEKEEREKWMDQQHHQTTPTQQHQEEEVPMDHPHPHFST